MKPSELTADERAALGEVTEAVRQVQEADAGARAVALQQLIPLVDRAGLRVGAPDAGPRRAALPAWVVSELENRLDSLSDHDPSRVLQAVHAALDSSRGAATPHADGSRIGEVTGYDLSVLPSDVADSATVQVHLPDGTTRTIGIEVGPLPSGVVAVPTIADGKATITIDGRQSSTAIQIALAGALAELMASSEGAPTGPALLAPGDPSGPLTESNLTVADRRELAEFRMAGLLAQLSLQASADRHTGFAKRWQNALAEALGLHGSGDGPVTRRGVLTPIEERRLAARRGGELEERVLARQSVEAAAHLAGATSERVGADQVVATIGERRVVLDIDVQVIGPDGRAVAQVEVIGDNHFRVVVSPGSAASIPKIMITQQVDRALRGGPDPSMRPAPPPGPTNHASAQTEDEFFNRMRTEVNTTGWDDDDKWPVEWPDQPLNRRLPRIPTEPPDPTIPDRDDKEPAPPTGPHPPENRPRPQPGQPDCPVVPPADGPRPHLPPPYLPPPVPPCPTPLLPPAPPVDGPPVPPVPPPVAPPPPVVGTPVPPAPLPPVTEPPVPPPPGQGIHPSIVWWLDFLDPWGNHHLIALIEVPLPGGGSISLVLWLIFPADALAAPAVILAELVGTAEPLALRDHAKAVADTVRALLLDDVPGLDLDRLRWLVHHGAFSTPDGTLTEMFHELTLRFDGVHHWLDAVRMLDPSEVADLVMEMNLRPIPEVVAELLSRGSEPTVVAPPARADSHSTLS